MCDCFVVVLLFIVDIHSISGFSSAADVFAYGVVTRLMWQTSSKSYLSSNIDQNDDPAGFYDSFRRESADTAKRPKPEFDNGHSCDTSPFK